MDQHEIRKDPPEDPGVDPGVDPGEDPGEDRENLDMFRVLVHASLLSTRRLLDILVCHLFDLSFGNHSLRELRYYDLRFLP